MKTKLGQKKLKAKSESSILEIESESRKQKFYRSAFKLCLSCTLDLSDFTYHKKKYLGSIATIWRNGSPCDKGETLFPRLLP
jgi:hypothetical protein